MATSTTTKKTTSTAKAKDEINAAVNNETVSAENEALKKQMAEMQAQMEAMMKIIGNQTAPTEKKKPKKNIKFVNLSNGGVSLRGTRMHSMEKQFEVRSFSEAEARSIVANTPNLIREGFVYIMDSDFVEDNDLSDVYENLLNDKQMEELLTKDSAYVVDVYRNASEGQKEIIVDMIINKKLLNSTVDANIVEEIGKLCGKDLRNIEPLEEA